MKLITQKIVWDNSVLVYNLCMNKIDVIKSKFLYGSFNQNTYVLSDKNSAVIIDVGGELDDVKQKVSGKKVLGILMTHLHFDHFWNLEEYLKEFGCDVYIQPGFENKFLDGRLNASYLVGLNETKNIAKNQIKYYAKNLKLGNFEFEIFNTPGHSKDGVCILFDEILFTGDTVFSDTIGRTDLPDSDNSEMIDSLKKIKSLDYITAYPGHNESASKAQIDKTIGFYL